MPLIIKEPHKHIINILFFAFLVNLCHV